MKILITGEGGQGVQTVAQIVSSVAYNHKFKTSYMPHYGVEMRMGISVAFLQISKNEIYSPKFVKADILIVMSPRELELTKSFIDKKTAVVNLLNFDKIIQEHNLPNKSLNMIAIGIIAKYLNTTELRLDFNKLQDEIKNKFIDKDVLEKNILALKTGYDLDVKSYNTSFDNYRKLNLSPVLSKDKEKEFWRFPTQCKGCGLCIVKCPVHALSWTNENKNFLNLDMPKVDLTKCTACQTCEHICPDCAIKVVRKK